jgi:hypothetical protein
VPDKERIHPNRLEGRRTAEDQAIVERHLPSGWTVGFTVHRKEGRLDIVEARVWSTQEEPPQGLSAIELREAVAIGGVRDEAERVLGSSTEAPWASGVRSLASTAGSVDREGDLAITALAYLLALEGGSKSPNADVAVALGVSTARVTRWLHDARVDGLLIGAGRRGVMGGTLTLKGDQAIARALRARLGLEPDQGIVVITGLGRLGDADVLGRFLKDAADDRSRVSDTEIVVVNVTNAGVELQSFESMAQPGRGPGGEDALVLRR